jgi:hypothetical protein
VAILSVYRKYKYNGQVTPDLIMDLMETKQVNVDVFLLGGNVSLIVDKHFCCSFIKSTKLIFSELNGALFIGLCFNLIVKKL